MENHQDGNLSEMANELGAVQACDCGGIHLTMGVVSIHLNADDVDPLFELIAAGKNMSDAWRRREARRNQAGKRRRSGKVKLQGTMH